MELLTGRHEVLAPRRSDFDLAEPETLGEALDRFRPDFILNPAAYTAVDKAEDERELAFASTARHRPPWPIGRRGMRCRCCISRPTMCSMVRVNVHGGRKTHTGPFRPMGRASSQVKLAFAKRVVRT